jgi:putative transposase
MIERGNMISIKHQCRLLGIQRSGLYYKPKGVGPEDLELMKRIDSWHLKDPTLGTRRMSAFISNEGYSLGRDKARSLMRLMRIKTVYCRPRTTISDKSKYKYPYLLNSLAITRANQVWAIDITYIPMKRGFMYMVAIIDLYSRYIIGWSISNTMDAEWVADVVKEAISIYGKPDIINSDQGSQFTSDEYIGLLKKNTIEISMDGKGRALDNIFIERFWRTIKHDKIYLYPPMDGKELYRICQQFIKYYNNERLHESHGYKAPAEIYHQAA